MLKLKAVFQKLRMAFWFSWFRMYYARFSEIERKLLQRMQYIDLRSESVDEDL